MNYGLILFCTFIFFLPKQLATAINLNESYRFLTAKDTVNVRKAALLAMVLMAFGSIIFFIPPWATAILNPDAAAAYSELGSKASDSVYLVFTREFMPAGTVGLLVAGLFAATMSCMDSALNKTAGIFVRSVYQPLLARRNRTVDDNRQLWVGKLVSLISGISAICAALFFVSMQDLSLFQLMMKFSTMIQMPLFLPLILCFVVRRTPGWAPWATVAVGLGVSLLTAYVITADVFASWIGIHDLTRREASELSIVLTIAGHLLITSTFFVATTLFYKEEKDLNREETEKFFDDIATPVVSGRGQDEYDRQQRIKLGTLVSVMGTGILFMTLIPNPAWGRILFVLCALSILAIGASLKISARAS